MAWNTGCFQMRKTEKEGSIRVCGRRKKRGSKKLWSKWDQQTMFGNWGGGNTVKGGPNGKVGAFNKKRGSKQGGNQKLSGKNINRFLKGQRGKTVEKKRKGGGKTQKPWGRERKNGRYGGGEKRSAF